MPIGTLAFATVLAGILSIPGLIVVTWVRYPGRLKLDGEGIEVALGGRISHVAWHDVERAGITGGLLETPGDRLLAVRQWPSSIFPSSRITMPWTFRRVGIAVLCPVQIFTARPDDLREGSTGSPGQPGNRGRGYTYLRRTRPPACASRDASSIRTPCYSLAAMRQHVGPYLLDEDATLLRHTPMPVRNCEGSRPAATPITVICT